MITAMPILLDPEHPIGVYEKIFVARARDESIRRGKESGGAVTMLLVYLVEKGVVDAALVARKKTGITGEITVARTRREILEASGSKWSIVPYTMKLRETLESSELRRIAIVGLPCQAQFLRQVKMFPLLESDFGSKIYLVISLFCTGTFATEPFQRFLQLTYGIDPASISSIQFSGDKLVIKYRGGVKEIHASELLNFMQLGCLICPDYTGVFADISAGVSRRVSGYTVLIARNKLAVKTIMDAASQGYIEVREAPREVVEDVVARAVEKMSKANKYLASLL